MFMTLILGAIKAQLCGFPDLARLTCPILVTLDSSQMEILQGILTELSLEMTELVNGDVDTVANGKSISGGRGSEKVLKAKM